MARTYTNQYKSTRKAHLKPYNRKKMRMLEID